MHTLAPYVLARALFNLRRRSQAWLRSPPPADSDGDDRSQDASLLTRARRRTLGRLARVLAVLPPFERIRDDHVRAVHLALFYLFGRYYHLSKRLTGIRYVRNHPPTTAASRERVHDRQVADAARDSSR